MLAHPVAGSDNYRWAVIARNWTKKQILKRLKQSSRVIPMRRDTPELLLLGSGKWFEPIFTSELECFCSEVLPGEPTYSAITPIVAWLQQRRDAP